MLKFENSYAYNIGRINTRFVCYMQWSYDRYITTRLIYRDAVNKRIYRTHIMHLDWYHGLKNLRRLLKLLCAVLGNKHPRKKLFKKRDPKRVRQIIEFGF